MEHIDVKNSLNSKLQIYFICSIRIYSRKRDIIEKPLQHIQPLCTEFLQNRILEKFHLYVLLEFALENKISSKNRSSLIPTHLYLMDIGRYAAPLANVSQFILSQISDTNTIGPAVFLL